MPNLSGHFEAKVRGEAHTVSFVYDCDDDEGCYECIEVSVAGLALTRGERRRLIAKACAAASHHVWRNQAPARTVKRAKAA